MARKLQVEIVGDSRSVERAFSRASASANGFGSKMKGAAGLAAGAAVAGGLAIATGFGYALKAAGDFEQSLNSFRAVSHASGRQMSQVSALAKQLGRDVTLPATSAKDAAEAMTELAKGGLKVNDTMRAAKGVLQLAAAAQVSNAEAATITSRALNAFSLKGDQAVRVADVLANSANVSTGEITDMAFALQQASAVAAQAGLSIEETATAISLMANKGIVGSDAGTSLKTMLSRLIPQTKKAAGAMEELGVNAFDSNGKMLPLRNIIGQYHDALVKLNPKQRQTALYTIFGSDAIRAANILLGEGVGAYDKLRGAIGRQGAAAELAAAKMKGFKGSLEAFKSNVETLAITLGQALLPAATKAIQGVNGLFGFIEKVMAGKGIEAKLNIVWTGIQEAGQTITAKIGAAIAMVDWTAAWARAQGIGAGLQARFASINWTSVGTAIGDGLATGIGKSTEVAKKLSAAVAASARTIDWNALGRTIGPGLAAAMLSAFATLLDPVFWVKNWDLALAIAATVFGGAVGKITSKLFGVLARGLGPVFVGGVNAAARLIERVSPKLTEAFLAEMIRLPGQIEKVVKVGLGKLEAVVFGAFGRLEKLAKFTVKVLGIQAAINAVVGLAKDIWDAVKGLPGKMFALGRAIPAGIAQGVAAGASDVANAVAGLADQIPGWAKKALHIGSPSRVMAEQVGVPIGQGIAHGIMQSAGLSVAAMIAHTSALAAAGLGQVNKIQGQLDAISARRESEDRAAAVRDAAAALATARKKHEGVAAAEQAYARAREDVLVAAKQRELAKEQAALERRRAMVQKQLDKLNAAVQRAQDKASSIFDRMAGKIRSAFDAATSAWKSPAQGELDAIAARRQQEDLASAVEDAQKRLATAQEGSDPSEIARAQRDLARAQEDILVAAKEKQVVIEQRGWDQLRAAQAEGLDDMLASLKDGMTIKGASSLGSAMQALLNVLQAYGIDFASVGANLGQAFLDSLKASIAGTASAAVQVKGAVKASAKATRSARSIESLDSGGTVLRSGLAMVHRGETFSGVDGSYGTGGGGGDVHVHVNVEGSLLTEGQLVEKLRSGLARVGRRNGGSALGGLA